MPPLQVASTAPRVLFTRHPMFFFGCVCASIYVYAVCTLVSRLLIQGLYRNCFTSHMPGELVCKPSFRTDSGFQFWSTGSQSSFLPTEHLPGHTHTFLKRFLYVMIFSFSRMRKMPQRMKKVSCFASASLSSSRLPSLGKEKHHTGHGKGPEREVSMVSGTCMPSIGLFKAMWRTDLPDSLGHF